MREVEQPLGLDAIPQHVVERRDEVRARGLEARDLGQGVRRDEAADPRHLHARQHAFYDEPIDRGAQRARATIDAKVVGDPPLARDPTGVHGAHDLHASRLVKRRGRRAEHVVGNHVLGKRVAPLDALAARDREHAGRPERLEHPLRRRPLPVAGAGSTEVTRRDLASLTRRRDDLVGELRVLAEDALVPAVEAAVLHRVAIVRVVAHRQQARLVSPVLEHATRAQQAIVGELGELAAAACEHEPVRAIDGRDRVDLDAAETLDRLDQLVHRRGSTAGGEPLRADQQAPGLADAQLSGVQATRARRRA